MNRKELGKFGEKIAAKYLINKNYQVLANNYFSRFGEIDLIVFDQELKQLVFVEVKARISMSCGEPQEAVDRQKLRKIYKTALQFLSTKNPNNYISWRIDVIAVKLDKEKSVAKIKHYKNILDAAT